MLYIVDWNIVYRSNILDVFSVIFLVYDVVHLFTIQCSHLNLAMEDYFLCVFDILIIKRYV